jgi:nicotinamide-nucleotide amidase
VRAELVAVGSELLLGDAVDTNSAWIAGRLAEIGVDVHRHTTVGDNVGGWSRRWRGAARADVVIVTGGLGPTQDDLTRDAVAELAGVALERREELVDYVTSATSPASGRDMPETQPRQADLPARSAHPRRRSGPRRASPDRGRPGRGSRRRCTACPGVPREMKVMVARDVMPELVARAGLATTVSRVVRTAGMAESAVAEILLAALNDRLDARLPRWRTRRSRSSPPGGRRGCG